MQQIKGINATRLAEPYEIEYSYHFPKDYGKCFKNASLGYSVFTVSLSCWIKFTEAESSGGAQYITGTPGTRGSLELDQWGRIAQNGNYGGLPDYNCWNHIHLSNGRLHVNGNIGADDWDIDELDPAYCGSNVGFKMADFIFLSKSTVCTEFGEYRDGKWWPIEYKGGLGSQGKDHHLKFHPDDIGKDYSGNGHDFTPLDGISNSLCSTDTPTTSGPC